MWRAAELMGSTRSSSPRPQDRGIVSLQGTPPSRDAVLRGPDGHVHQLGDGIVDHLIAGLVNSASVMPSRRQVHFAREREVETRDR